MDISAIGISDFESKKYEPSAFFEVTGEFLREKPNTVAKMIYNAIDWLRIGEWVSQENKIANDVHFHAKCFKNIHTGPLGIVKQWEKIHSAGRQVFSSSQLSDLGEFSLCCNNIMGAIYDSVALWSTAVREIPKGMMMNLNKCCGVAVIISKICEIWRIKNTGPLDGRQKFLDLGNHISYLVIGVLLVSSAFFGAIVPGWLLTLCTTSTIVFSTLGYYYKNFDKLNDSASCC